MLLHHFFILTGRFAPAADLLVDFGLIEGTTNDHPGQGTANRRFFFSNAALELLYVRDAHEATAGPARNLRLPERLSTPGASPFGLVLERGDDDTAPVFPGWHYQPVYFDEGTSFLVGDNSGRLDEPLCICMPDNVHAGPSQRQSAAPFAAVTELRVHVPVREPSPVLRAIAQVDAIRICTGRPHLLEIEFGHASESQHRDFRPALPLRILW